MGTLTSGLNIGFPKENTDPATSGITANNCNIVYQVNPLAHYNPAPNTLSSLTSFAKTSKGLLLDMKTSGVNLPWLQNELVEESDAPALAAPALTVTEISPTMISASCTSVSGAVSYRFELLIGSDWQIVQNNSTLQKSITGLTPSTTYQIRVQAVGDGINNSDSPYDTESATTSAAAPAPLFHATFGGPAALLANYTPENGTITSTLGNAGTDGVGNLVLEPASPGAFAVVEVGGAKPDHFRIVSPVLSIANSSDIQHAVRSSGNGSQYLLVQLTKTGAATADLVIINETPGQPGILANQGLTGLTYPLTLTTTFNHATGEISAKVNDGTPISTTDARSGLNKVAKIQTVNGATLSELTVEAI